MSNLCLVTKLKASVNNPELPIFGAMKLRISIPNDVNDYHKKISTYFGSAKIIIIKTGQELIVTSEGWTDLPLLREVEPTASYYEAWWISKYENCPKCNYYSNYIGFNVEDLKYNTHLKLAWSAQANSVSSGCLFPEGNLDNLGYHPELTHMSMAQCPNISWTMDKIIENFPNATTFNTESNKGVWDWNKAGNFKDLEKIQCYNSNSSQKGELYNFVQKQRELGNTTKQINYNWPNSVVTLFGNPLASTEGGSIKPFGYLKWTSDTVSWQNSATYGGGGTWITYDNNGNIIS